MQNPQNVQVLERAEALCARCYELARQLPVAEQYGLRSQIQRAAVSTAANISEGLGRGTNGDLERFLRIASGSAAELSTLLRIAFRVHESARGLIDETLDDTAVVSRMLNRFIATVARSRRRRSGR
jgi:four helix bundle protein